MDLSTSQLADLDLTFFGPSQSSPTSVGSTSPIGRLEQRRLQLYLSWIGASLIFLLETSTTGIASRGLCTIRWTSPTAATMHQYRILPVQHRIQESSRKDYSSVDDLHLYLPEVCPEASTGTSSTSQPGQRRLPRERVRQHEPHQAPHASSSRPDSQRT